MKYTMPTVVPMGSAADFICYTDWFKPVFSEIDAFMDSFNALFPAYEADE